MPALYQYKVNYGMNLTEYHAVWNKAYPQGSGVDWGANSVWGYMTGEVIQRALGTATSLSQIDLRRAVFSLSGKFESIAGPFELRSDGAQIGELPPVGQLQPNGKGGLDMVAVYPPKYAEGKAAFGK
jgi:branched-chain amino acid transport system substrate-binding protein